MNCRGQLQFRLGKVNGRVASLRSQRREGVKELRGGRAHTTLPQTHACVCACQRTVAAFLTSLLMRRFRLQLVEQETKRNKMSHGWAAVHELGRKTGSTLCCGSQWADRSTHTPSKGSPSPLVLFSGMEEPGSHDRLWVRPEQQPQHRVRA